MKIQVILFTVATAFSCCAATNSVPADHGKKPAELSASDILHRSAEKYASLKSYSDEGATASKLGKITAASYTFTIKLARPSRYQICWYEPDQVFTPKGVVWSAGDGDYLWMGGSFKPEKSQSREMALASATGISGGAAASIPGTFFKMPWGNQLGAAAAGAERQPDEKVGDVDCFVLTHGSGGRTNTLWIGKNDFLIHQIENDTSADLLKKTLEKQAKTNAHLRAILDASGQQMFQDSKTIEIHRNIKLNQAMSRKDFEFKVPQKSEH